MEHSDEIRAILKQVELWPPEELGRLARAVSAQAERRRGGADEARPSLGDLAGIANPSGRTYTDADVERLRHEAAAGRHLR